MQKSEETLNLCTEAAPLLEPPSSFLCFPAPTQHLHPYQGWVTGSFQTTVPILSAPAQITVQGAQQQTACSVSCPSAATTTAAPASQAGTSGSGSSCWVLPRSSFGYHLANQCYALWPHPRSCCCKANALQNNVKNLQSLLIAIGGTALEGKQIEEHHLEGFRGKKWHSSIGKHTLFSRIPEISAALQGPISLQVWWWMGPSTREKTRWCRRNSKYTGDTVPPRAAFWERSHTLILLSWTNFPKLSSWSLS